MPAFREALIYWLKLGFISFGGPAGQIAIMHKELVEKRKWISESHFLHALNFCMLLPGPEAQQLATYLGWRLHGWKGGVTAGSLFVLPSAVMLFVLSWLYMVGGHISWIAAIFYGLLPAVIAVIADAVLRIGKKTLKSLSLWGVAMLSFIGIYIFDISFVIIILSAALTGWLGHRLAPEQFLGNKFQQAAENDDGEAFLKLPASPPATMKRAVLVIVSCVVLWALPMIGLGLWLGWTSTPVAQGLFFSKAALVTFGGAYAVLPYVAQEAVVSFSWLSHQQMMSGLALAETTPGPLIIVLQFVGFVGGWQHPGNFSPLAGAGIGAFITVWATFIPCFLFVLLGAPFVERLRDLPRVGSALRAVTAAVVGVILNLGVVFASHALWPVVREGRLDGFVLVVAIAAFIAMWRYKIAFTVVLAACALLGLTSLI